MIGPIVTRGYGSFGTATLVVTRGYVSSDAPPVVTDRNAGGWEYARLGRRRTEEELREARIRFGVIPLSDAAIAVTQAVAAQERAVTSVDTQAKLSAARAGLEAEESFRRVYQAVYEDMLREDAAELFRIEIEKLKEMQQQAKRRKAAMLLLLLN